MIKARVKALLTTALIGSATLTMAACTKNKDNSEAHVTTDGNNQTTTHGNMRFTETNGNMVIYDANGKQVGTANNVIKILEQPTAHFVAFETQTPQEGKAKVIYHDVRGVVAKCGNDCRVTIKDNFAAFVLGRKNYQMAAGLVTRDGTPHYFASRMDSNARLRQVNIMISDNFALVQKRSGIHLFNKKGQSRKIRSQCREGVRRCIRLNDNFLVINRGFGDYEISFADNDNLRVNCNNCSFSNHSQAPRGVLVGNRNTILMSNSFILVPNSRGQAVLYSRQGQNIVRALGGSRVKMNNYFAGVNHRRNGAALYHYRQITPLRTVQPFGGRTFIQLSNNRASIGIRGQGSASYDNSGTQL